jgi:DNA-binding MarR family transcriptional regulator
MPVAANNSSEAHGAVTALSGEILALLGKVSEQFSSGEAQQCRWLAEHSPDASLVEILRDSTLMAMRVLNAIGQLEPINGITISERHKIPKGTVSKVTRRLMAQKLIVSETLPNNRKEILFRLTPLGRQLYELHRQFDELMERGFRRFLQRYEAEELALLVRVLRDATEASFLNLGLSGGGARERPD